MVGAVAIVAGSVLGGDDGLGGGSGGGNRVNVSDGGTGKAVRGVSAEEEEDDDEELLGTRRGGTYRPRRGPLAAMSWM